MNVRKSVIAAAAALALLGGGSAATARFISLSSVSFRGFLIMEGRWGLNTTRCPVTVEGTFVGRTLTKVSETLIGSITRATPGACEVGTISFLPETLPWPMVFRAFTGTLPTITSIKANIDRFSVRLRAGVNECLFESERAEPETITFEVTAGRIRAITMAGEIAKPCMLFAGRINAANSATQEPTVLNETARIEVRLI